MFFYKVLIIFNKIRGLNMDKETIYAGIVGGVVADALGVPYEFKSYSTMQEYPAIGMMGYGTYNQPPGTWSDDSSMTLALMDSLINGVDYKDMIEKFCDWFLNAKYTPLGDVFDIGNTTRSSLRNYYYDHLDPLDCGLTGGRDNGNGSLMRVMPILLYINAKDLDLDKQIELVDNVSALTHAHKISKASCNIYNFIVQEVLNNKNKDLKTLIGIGIDKSRQYYENSEYDCFETIYNDLFSLSDDYIGSNGFVVDSLEVALYCSYHTDSYEDAVLKAVNYGGDTDTNAMIAGGLVALYYGFEAIPENWLNKIIKLDYILDLCDKFFNSVNK